MKVADLWLLGGEGVEDAVEGLDFALAIALDHQRLIAERVQLRGRMGCQSASSGRSAWPAVQPVFQQYQQCRYLPGAESPRHLLQQGAGDLRVVAREELVALSSEGEPGLWPAAAGQGCAALPSAVADEGGEVLANRVVADPQTFAQCLHTGPGGGGIR